MSVPTRYLIWIRSAIIVLFLGGLAIVIGVSSWLFYERYHDRIVISEVTAKLTASSRSLEAVLKSLAPGGRLIGDLKNDREKAIVDLELVKVDAKLLNARFSERRLEDQKIADLYRSEAAKLTLAALNWHLGFNTDNLNTARSSMRALWKARERLLELGYPQASLAHDGLLMRYATLTLVMMNASDFGMSESGMWALVGSDTEPGKQ